LFSDGIIDQFGQDNPDKFKINRLLSIIEKNYTKPIKEQIRFVENEFEKWKGNTEQIDDVLFMGVKI
jgi:serine phosphatase RsbU (regulator of sigma subunit)